MTKAIALGALVVAMLAVAACGPLASAAAPAASPSPGRAGGFARNGASGQLVQINGQTLILTGQNGDTTVSYSSGTAIERRSTGTTADIATGMCVVVSGQQGQGTVTAATVQLSAKPASGCATGRGPGQGGPGQGAGRRSPRPAPSGAQANMAFVTGEVTAVSGIQVTVTPASGTAHKVSVPTTAAVNKLDAGSPSDLQVNQCVLATGTKDAKGTVQATALTVSPPSASGGCATGLGGGGGRRPGG